MGGGGRGGGAWSFYFLKSYFARDVFPMYSLCYNSMHGLMSVLLFFSVYLFSLVYPGLAQVSSLVYYIS